MKHMLLGRLYFISLKLHYDKPSSSQYQEYRDKNSENVSCLHLLIIIIKNFTNTNSEIWDFGLYLKALS